MLVDDPSNGGKNTLGLFLLETEQPAMKDGTLLLTG